ncbi:response regulator transcription factor [Pseudomonadota bacterium AL_CKDN230030165-1A_HGKHYDSX7]
MTLLLTPREIECLRWAAAGYPSNAIGVRLGITPRTVEFHLTNAREKLGSRNRCAAVARAQQLGLLTPPAPLPAQESAS